MNKALRELLTEDARDEICLSSIQIIILSSGEIAYIFGRATSGGQLKCAIYDLMKGLYLEGWHVVYVKELLQIVELLTRDEEWADMSTFLVTTYVKGTVLKFFVRDKKQDLYTTVFSDKGVQAYSWRHMNNRFE